MYLIICVKTHTLKNKKKLIKPMLRILNRLYKIIYLQNIKASK